MTDKDVKKWLVSNYHKDTDRNNQMHLKIGHRRYFRIVAEMVEAGSLSRKVQNKLKLKIDDAKFYRSFLNRKGTLSDFAEKLGVTATYVDNRIQRIRRKIKAGSFDLKPKRKYKVNVHPLVTKAWLPGFMEGAK